VFQLLTFFMVVINFEQTQADERVKLPRDQLAKPNEVKREHKVVVNMGFIRDKEGNKLSDPEILLMGERVPVLNFGPALKTEARIYRLKNIDPKEVTVVIRADSEIPTGLVQELIRLAQEAEFEKFAMAAQQASDP
ncbi:MAG: biopolymer transporter ExbD, partial [Planctomycetota bacterium]|nr:biopolymer transporter ExbD [Planctomycetota bacterium]